MTDDEGWASTLMSMIRGYKQPRYQLVVAQPDIQPTIYGTFSSSAEAISWAHANGSHIAVPTGAKVRVEPEGGDAEPELSPCPFCGDEPRMADFMQRNDFAFSGPNPDFCIICTSCGYFMGNSPTRTEAGAKWNRRTST